MKISIFSQNLAGKNLPSDENDAFTNIGENIKPDIYVEYTQEDNRNINSNSLIPGRFLDGYSPLCVQSLSTKQPFNIITKVYTKSDNYVKIDSGSIKLNKFSGSVTSMVERSLRRIITNPTKGSTWVLIKNADIADYNILLVNMHLPIDTGKYSLFKNESLGNEHRKESMISILRKIYQKIYKRVDIKTLKVFIGGDLNFRVIHKTNQLTNFLKSEIFPFFELSRNLGSTCKYLTTCSVDRTDNIECLDPSRSPSRCDRFLTNIPLSNLNILSESNIVFNPGLDHNGIAISIELSLLFRSGRQGSKISIENMSNLNIGGRRTRKNRKIISYRKTRATPDHQ